MNRMTDNDSVLKLWRMLLADHEEQTKTNPDHICFRCTINDDQYEDIIMYNELMDYIQKNAENDETLWRFKRISRHQGPFTSG